MEPKTIIFEISTDKQGYDIWAHNESKSISRTYAGVESTHLPTLLERVTHEILGEPANEEDECVALIEANEDALQEIAQKDYHGSKDGWEDFFSNWLENHDLSEIKALLKI